MSDRQLEFHPLANIFPLLEGAEFDELVADIKAHGQNEPIELLGGKILDGRNRYRACLEAGVEPDVMIWPPYSRVACDPVSYVISKNLRRRHLSESQRAMVAAKLATLKRGDNQHSPDGETSQGEAAELLNVSKRSVERAADVRKQGTPELQEAVEHGYISVAAAADIATLPEDEQREIVAKGQREILEAAKRIRTKKAEARRAERMRKLVELSRRDAPLLSDRRYPVILADPAWQFRVHIGAGNDDSADQHYPTMDTDAICALPVADLATPDAVLFMWTPACNLPDALRVLEAWGFEFVTHAVWVKPKAGKLGHWVRTQHEDLLIARRSAMPTPLPANRPPSVFNAPRREHSRKPDEAYELIEKMFPDLSRIELFARNTREGWDAWGNEAPQENSVAEDDAA